MTKKILSLILLATLFVACGDDKDEYYNPVEGAWVYTTPMGNTETRVYTSEFEGYSVSNTNGVINKRDYGTYSVDDDKTYFKKFTHKYRIVEDTLWLHNPDTEWKKKYIREK